MATPRREAFGQGSDPSHERMYNPVSNTVSGQLGGTGEGFLQGRMVWEGPGLEVKGNQRVPIVSADASAKKGLEVTSPQW